MCGRFTRNFTWREVHDFLNLTFPAEIPITPSYNVAPTQATPVCRAAEGGGRELVTMVWGFTRHWTPESKGGPINARVETVSTSPMFRQAFAGRRCIVPVSGFYEWKKTGDVKQPYYIVPREGGIFALAGIWEGRPGAESFAILTAPPNALMETMHDRMPLVLRPHDVATWLAVGPADPAAFTPADAPAMRAYPVSSRVNSPRNDSPSLVEPAEPEGLFGGM